MEFASKLRWILILFLTLVIIIITGWGLYTIAKRIFTSGSDLPAQISNVYEVSNADSTTFHVDGPVVASEDHRSYDITVSQNVASIKVYKAYGATVISEKSYLNTQESYSTFLSALENLDVANRVKNTTETDDLNYAGICAIGKTYILSFDNDLTRWSTTCSRKQGTANFAMVTVKDLFEKQIPDFREIIRGINL